MALDRELSRAIRRLDQFELRRLQILIRGLLLGTDPDLQAETDAPVRVTYRQQSVRCGKAGCTRCPHGPYWYGYWRENGKLRSRYIGKTLPADVVVDDGP
jgi:hypothetical protein